MEVLVVYDVATESPAGAVRLRKVAHVCQAYGQRVQKSVFECVLLPEQVELLRNELLEIIDVEVDSIRMYRLREPHDRFTWTAGRQPRWDIRGPIIA